MKPRKFMHLRRCFPKSYPAAFSLYRARHILSRLFQCSQSQIHGHIWCSVFQIPVPVSMHSLYWQLEPQFHLELHNWGLSSLTCGKLLLHMWAKQEYGSYDHLLPIRLSGDVPNFFIGSLHILTSLSFILSNFNISLILLRILMPNFEVVFRILRVTADVIISLSYWQ